MRFTVYGEPRGKGRPRFSAHGGFVRTYTDKETASYENLIKMAYIDACGGEPITYHNAVLVSIEAHISIPTSVSKKKHQEMLCGLIKPTKKPDTDNVIKSVLDGLNKVAFDDDKQVVMINATKIYSEQPKLVVEVKET